MFFTKLKQKKAEKSSSYNTRNSDQIETYCCRTDILKSSFFPLTIAKSKRLDHTFQNSKSYIIFKNSLLKIGRPVPKPTFDIQSPLVLELLTHLRLRLSNLYGHTFNHNFEDCIILYV